MSNVGGFPTALGGQSPEEVFSTGARDVNVGCRNGFEASWRRDRGNAARRYEGTASSGVTTTVPDGTGDCSPRSKGAPGKQRSKGQRKPLVHGVRRIKVGP